MSENRISSVRLVTSMVFAGLTRLSFLSCPAVFPKCTCMIRQSLSWSAFLRRQNNHEFVLGQSNRQSTAFRDFHLRLLVSLVLMPWAAGQLPRSCLSWFHDDWFGFFSLIHCMHWIPAKMATITDRSFENYMTRVVARKSVSAWAQQTHEYSHV